MKPREFKLRHSTLIMNDLSASNFKPDDLVYVREVVPIDWEKVWNECALREYAEYISHSNREFIQKLVEKQLAGEQ